MKSQLITSYEEDQSEMSVRHETTEITRNLQQEEKKRRY